MARRRRFINVPVRPRRVVVRQVRRPGRDPHQLEQIVVRPRLCRAVIRHVRHLIGDVVLHPAHHRVAPLIGRPRQPHHRIIGVIHRRRGPAPIGRIRNAGQLAFIVVRIRQVQIALSVLRARRYLHPQPLARHLARLRVAEHVSKSGRVVGGSDQWKPATFLRYWSGGQLRDG